MITDQPEVIKQNFGYITPPTQRVCVRLCQTLHEMTAENSVTPERVNSSSLVQPHDLGPLSLQLVIMCSVCPLIKYELLEGRNHVLIISVFPVPGTHSRHLINGWQMNEASAPNQRGVCFRGIQVEGVPSQPIYLWFW